jgi:hypothetical protein
MNIIPRASRSLIAASVREIHGPGPGPYFPSRRPHSVTAREDCRHSHPLPSRYRLGSKYSVRYLVLSSSNQAASHTYIGTYLVLWPNPAKKEKTQSPQFRFMMSAKYEKAEYHG